VLFTRYFATGLGTTDTTGTDILTNPLFAEWVPVTAGAASIVILDPSGNMLSSTSLTGAAPVVTITSPAAGFVGSGQQTVSWKATSATATTFTSRIYDSTDGGTTWQQIDETTDLSDTLDFSTLPGASSVLLRVDVSDGVNTGSATSVAFNVPKKLPSTIVINTPATGAAQPAANPVYLSGAAYDADDGVLTGTALSWSDSVQGVLGTGSPLQVTLPAGPHTIKLTGTDSDGNAITATTQITLGGGAPTLSLTTNSPSSGCYTATINAGIGTKGAALSLVRYSLDGGATYTPVSLAQLPYTLQVTAGSDVNVVATAVDASGQTSAQSAHVIGGTGCAGSQLKSAGGSSQSANVGTAFAAPLTVTVQDLLGNPVAGATVTFVAPATGAGAALSASSAVTAANGSASVTATANGTAGSYSITATTPNAAGAVSFALANTDFTAAVGSASLTVLRGASASESVSVTPLGGFSAAVALSCTGLPTGVTCSFAPANVTPQGAAASSTLTVSATTTAAKQSPLRPMYPVGSGVLLACGVAAFLLRRRTSRLYRAGLTLVALGVWATLVGCSSRGGGGGTVTLGPATNTINVVATSGTLQRTATISVTVQ
jgi:hypothetical protein